MTNPLRATARFTPTICRRPSSPILRVVLPGVLSLLMAAASAAAQSNAPAPDFDIRAPRDNALPSAPSSVTTTQKSALDELSRAAQGQLVVSWSELTRAPSRLTGRGQPLSPPSSESPSAIATSFIEQVRPLLKLSAQDVQGMQESRDFQTSLNAATHLSLQQRANSIDVFGGDLRINIDASGQVLNLSGEPIPNVNASVDGVLPGT